MRLKSDVNIKNRRASFDYEILDRYVAGIQLYGTEIKSIRESKASLVDTYCQFVGRELWVKQMHIAEYRFGSYTNHEAKRDRKLLMTKKELRKLEKQPNLTVNKMQLLHNALSGKIDDYDFDYDEAFAKIISDFTKVEDITLPKKLEGTLRAYQEIGMLQ